MRKKVIAGLAAVLAVGAFTGCGVLGGKDIGRDSALEAALGDAGVNESDTTRLKVSEDYDDGRKTYEIRFDVEAKEYEYEVSASDGKILSAYVEEAVNKDTSGESSSGQNQQTQDGTGNADVSLSMDEAISIAL